VFNVCCRVWVFLAEEETRRLVLGPGSRRARKRFRGVC
jgi:hypothetical protein